MLLCSKNKPRDKQLEAGASRQSLEHKLVAEVEVGLPATKLGLSAAEVDGRGGEGETDLVLHANESSTFLFQLNSKVHHIPFQYSSYNEMILDKLV
ncbi:uncharacterized protein LOC111044821 isoform X3 [Nilaparvata lugens]|uniref:uncharacterized protein LOC111044821 isoform X3 n=1 Tax=Nilaparvata lugens TaxID=108931 RepID=UPI00193CF357|nr:uncharacterized protein LOC111044821 isoform X3 [Nilaparvata lugens]